MIPERYTLANLKRAAAKPHLVAKELGTLYRRYLSPRRYAFELAHAGKDRSNPLTRDWDNLILLDACRADYLRAEFDGQYDGQYDVEEVVLDSSTSGGFIDTYTSSGAFLDTVYVTANPFVSRVPQGTFADVMTTFDAAETDEFQMSLVEDVSRSWSPERVLELAKDAHERYPDKRLLVHFMQPHAPYFGDRAAELRRRLNDDGIRFWAWDDDLDRADLDEGDVLSHLLYAAKEGHITAEELQECYAENLAYVLEYAFDLADHLDGRTVFSSDHGEKIGDVRSLRRRHRFGHGNDIFRDELRVVPWVTVRDGRRRAVTSATETNNDQSIDAADLDEQLRSLGYK